MTSDFSRGTDFKLNVKNLNEYEGLHVIQAFMPESSCDYIQLIGRTGRQGKNGSVMIYAV
jgi:superfamily II DNA/RNA helicase